MVAAQATIDASNLVLDAAGLPIDTPPGPANATINAGSFTATAFIVGEGSGAYLL